jgi:hypothetical protein
LLSLFKVFLYEIRKIFLPRNTMTVTLLVVNPSLLIQ